MSRIFRFSSAGIIGLVLFGCLMLVIANNIGFVRSPWIAMQRLENLLRGSIGVVQSPEGWIEERRALLEELSEARGLADENAQLRAAMSFVQRTNFQYAIANVVSRDPLSPSIVYLNIGTNEGIAVGQPVVIKEGTLIGKIIKITSSNATVELITSDSARVAVRVLDDSGTSGVVRGSLGMSARLEYIRDVASLSVGDTVVTSGLEPLVPQGLLVGTVQKIVDNPDELFAYADIIPAADLTRLSIVSVLRGI